MLLAHAQHVAEVFDRQRAMNFRDMLDRALHGIQPIEIIMQPFQ
jgi:hypothetical protein